MDLFELLSYWLARFGQTLGGWVARTAQWAGDWYEKAYSLYDTNWGRISWYTSHTIFYRLDAAMHLVMTITAIFDYPYFWVEEVYNNIVFWWRQIAVFWPTRLMLLFEDKWTWAETWYTDWIQYVTWLLDNHKPKIHAIFSTDWLKVNWLVLERWTDIFNVIEPHVAGWRTFAEDPAQGIWDFVKPRLQGLVANYLVELW